MNTSSAESCNDDKYIYLDEEGNATPKFETTVSLNNHPRIQVFVTCSPKEFSHSHSLTFLRLRTTEEMENYPMFSGLRNLETINLSRRGLKLPEEGVVKDYLKSSDMLTCNLRSDDIWLDVTIDCSELSQLIHFEIKLNRSLYIYELKATLTWIINESLNLQKGNNHYSEEDLSVRKKAYNSKKSSLEIERENSLKILKSKELENNNQIDQFFTSIDRFVQVFTKVSDFKKLAGSEESMTNMVIASHELTNVLPIRLFRFEDRYEGKKSYRRRSYSQCGKCMFL